MFGKKINIRIAFAMLAAIMLVLSLDRAFAAPVRNSKPMIPVEISIVPTTAKTKPQDIKPGAVIELVVTARSFSGTDDIRVEITLLDGAELVSGDLLWSGKLSGNESKKLVISVRAPATGAGKVTAAVFVVRNGNVSSAKHSVYTLGAEKNNAKGKSEQKTRRDSKGREVIEY